jgi:hypothetical protein
MAHFNMENLNVFEVVTPEAKASNTGAGPIIEEPLIDITELDPTLELSLDLNTLLVKQEEQASGHEVAAAATTDSSHQLFPELAAHRHSEDGTGHEEEEEDSLMQETEEWERALVAEQEASQSKVKVEGLPVLIDNTLEIDDSAFLVNQLDLSNYLIGSPPPLQENISTPPRSNRGRPRSSTSTLKAPSPLANDRRRRVPKDSDEYKNRRERNNIAVRKSRDKAKYKQEQTEDKLKALSDHNEDLIKKVDLLTKELTVLKGLFVNIGASLPKNLDQLVHDRM